MSVQQATTDLWQELRDALAIPQAANLRRLCELLDWVIAHLPETQQLEIASRAVEQIVEIYALRFNVLMAVWEGSDHLSEDALPVLNLEVFESWIRQSMSVDLDGLIEQPKSKQSRKKWASNPADSAVAVVEPEAVLQMVEQIEAEEHNQMIRKLAGEEDPARWSAAIGYWMQQYAPNQSVLIDKLPFSLKMPWVEIWMGLLLNGGFSLRQTGDFYSNEILVEYSPARNNYRR